MSTRWCCYLSVKFVNKMVLLYICKILKIAVKLHLKENQSLQLPFWWLKSHLRLNSHHLSWIGNARWWIVMWSPTFMVWLYYILNMLHPPWRTALRRVKFSPNITETELCILRHGSFYFFVLDIGMKFDHRLDEVRYTILIIVLLISFRILNFIKHCNNNNNIANHAIESPKLSELHYLP